MKPYLFICNKCKKKYINQIFNEDIYNSKNEENPHLSLEEQFNLCLVCASWLHVIERMECYIHELRKVIIGK